MPSDKFTEDELRQVFEKLNLSFTPWQLRMAVLLFNLPEGAQLHVSRFREGSALHATRYKGLSVTGRWLDETQSSLGTERKVSGRGPGSRANSRSTP